MAADFNQQLKELTATVEARLQAGDSPAQVLKDKGLRQAFRDLTSLPAADRQAAGQQLNQLRQTIVDYQTATAGIDEPEPPDQLFLDPTAPVDIGGSTPPSLPAIEQGSIHPVSQALAEVIDIFGRMGFEAVESRQIDSEYYMFDSLNFPVGHPARAEFDTFHLVDADSGGRSLVAPAHTSAMQHRILKERRAQLVEGQPIAMVVPGRVFRHEDVDASHDHMFYQLEGIYVDRQVTVANLIGTLKDFLQTYYGQALEIKVQPFYFPFTEPSFELAISCPFCSRQEGGCRVCSQGWIELLGCGAIHPNVLSAAGIDPKEFSGFAWGIGLTRLAMIKHNIDDIRHFASGRVEFLRQF